MAIDVSEPVEKALEFQRRHALTFPVAADPTRRLFNHFFFPPDYNLPYMLLVSRDGVIRIVYLRLASLSDAIEKLL